MRHDWENLKVGDTAIRLLAETAEMTLRVTKIDAELIHCGDWTFDRATLVEVDDDLGWGPTYGVTGSRLTGFEAAR